MATIHTVIKHSESELKALTPCAGFDGHIPRSIAT